MRLRLGGGALLIVVEGKPINIALRLGELTGRRQRIALTSPAAPAAAEPSPVSCRMMEAWGFHRLGSLQTMREVKRAN